MKKSRLAHIFFGLDKKEIRDLRKWLLSPAHNQREDVLLLFDYLEKYGKKAAEGLLDKSTVFAAIFPEEKQYDDAKVRQVMYFLLKSTEEFLIYNEFLKDKTEQKLLLARALGEKKMKKYFQKSIFDLLKELENSDLRDKEYFRKKYTGLFENYQYLSKNNRTVDFNLQDIFDVSDIHFLSLKLRQSCIMASHQRVYKTDYDLDLAKAVLRYTADKKLYEIPTVGIYYYGYKLIAEDENEENFQQFRDILFKYDGLFSKEELGEIYLIAINYRIRKFNTSNAEVLRELFEIYKRGFETGVLLLENQITVYTFNNVVLIGVTLREYDWAEKFIENHQIYLSDENRTSTVFYCRARLEHHRGNYEEAMVLFNKVEHSDILLTLNAKTFLLKMYYEQDEIQLLDALLDSMRTYLRRKKVVGYYKENYKNIIRYTKKLAHVNPFSKNDKLKLQEEVQTVSPLTEKKWILERLGTVKK